MKKYIHLLFDADGTLFDFKRTETRALDQTFRKYGIQPTKEIFQQYNDINHALWSDFEQGFIDKETVITTRFRLLFIDLDLSIDPIAFEADYQPALGKGAYLINGALTLCQKLKKNYKLYIVTNGVSSTQYSRLKASGLDRLMNGIFVSEDIGTQKPNKDFFDYVAARIPDCKSRTTLIIGDSLSSDIQGGINANIDTCWYNPEKLPNEQDITPTYEIENLNALLSILGI